MLQQAKARAKSMGGDGIHIYEERTPDILSTCYRIKAQVLSFERGESTGTAFFIDNNGTMLTASHVIDKAKKITVQCQGAEEMSARIIKQSRNTDIAQERHGH